MICQPSYLYEIIVEIGFRSVVNPFRTRFDFSILISIQEIESVPKGLTHSLLHTKIFIFLISRWVFLNYYAEMVDGWWNEICCPRGKLMCPWCGIVIKSRGNNVYKLHSPWTI